ncbi:MAG TPA: hypothetical protein VFN60_04635, partial [Acidimicrobiales bacterium]|nr:hypothetical protein [Acidimicrobiales bacterium]
DLLEQVEETEGIQRRGLVLAALTKLKQVCNHPAHFLADGSALPGRSGKLTRVEELLEEIVAEGHKVLCFTQFTAWGDLLLSHLQAPASGWTASGSTAGCPAGHGTGSSRSSRSGTGPPFS